MKRLLCLVPLLVAACVEEMQQVETEDMTKKQRYKETVESNTEKLKKLKADENFLLSVTTAFAGSELESTQKSIKKLNEDIENHEREIYNLGNTKKDIERKGKLIDTIAAKKRKIEILEKRKQSYEENLTLYNYALKPVFGINGETVTREESESYISKYEAMHPEFKDIAKKVWNYSQNINAMRSSAGLISHSMMERMKTLYPHYVPAWRAEIGNGGKSDKGIRVESTVKKAKGYNHNLVHVDVALATQTKQALKNGSINVLANEIYDSSIKSGDVKFVDVGFDPDVGAKKISAGMTDNERYLILKDKELSLSATVDIKKVASAQVELKISDEDIEFSKYGDKKRLFKKLGEEFSVFHGYKNDDIKLEFKFSKGNIAESVSKQGKNYTDFAKMLSCFDEVVENAIGIEVHNRNKEGYKKDDTLKNVYVLASAFTDGKKIVPVKLEVKEFSDKENTLHVAIALESIEKDGIVKQEVAKDGVARQYSPPSGISIAEFLGKINPKDESFYKYIPKQFTEAAESEREEGEGRSKPHKITFFRNGKEYSMDVSDEIYLGFKGITEATVPPSNVISKAMGKVNKLFKSVVTSLSPAFTIRNAVRDIQDAGFNTKHGKGFAKNIPIAWKEIITNSERWKLYRAHGGFASTVFDSKGFEGAIGDRGFEEIKLFERFANGQKLSKKELVKNALYLKDLLTGIENVNAVVEQIPRFAEFLASLEAGEDVQTAIYNSAEVTTNFGRRGAMAKHLNATVIPFLNPAIQGFDKIFRNVNDAVSGKGSAKSVVGGVLGLFTKAFIIGMVPMIFNSLLYSDDEDYENLREEDKENNYLFKLASGRFFRLPRGRVASVVSGFTNRVERTISGKDSDWGGYFENVVSQITPVGNVTRNFFSPISDVNTNTTWYGTAIEGREYENVRPSQRYDESTSDIAIALGKAFNYSPKKIHYLLDQYLGVVGDFILPATTKQAEKGYILGNFTIDPVTSNKLSTRFYELYDEAKYAKKEGDTAAIYQVKYFDEAGTAVRLLYDEIEKIQKSDKSDEDKLNEVRTLRVLINAVLKSSIDGYSAFTNAIPETEHLGYDDSKTSERTKRYNQIRKLAFDIDSGMYDEIKETYDPKKEEKKSSSPYAGLFSSKTSSGTSSGSSSKSYSALFSKNKKTSGAKSDKKLSYGALLGVK